MALEIDPDRRLALAYVPGRSRSAVEALWRLDLALGSVLATGREPMISRIRLAWWRESLEKLDHEKPPAEPMLAQVARSVLPRGISGAELARMEEGWAVLLSPEPLTADDLRAYAFARGSLLFRYTARLLGEQSDLVDAGGAAWALTDLARNGAAPESGTVLEAVRNPVGAESWPSRLRPLGMLAALALRDSIRGPARMERPGAPARMMRMLAHRLTGR